MTNHLGGQTSESDANPAVIIELPNGSTEKIAVGDKNATVRDLKVACELQFGIPCHLQQVSALENPSVELNDWSPLRDVVQTIDDVIVVQVPVWWNKFICVSLNNEIDNVCRRAKLPMQQISKEDRLFVGYFIACCRGHEDLLHRLKALDIQLDQRVATEAGRNLFHAAAASGKVNCVEFVAKHLIKPSKEILTMLDTNRETPIDIARRLNHHETERLLYKYMYHEKGDREERSSAESGIDVSEECGSVDSDDSSEERITGNKNTVPEGTWKVHENNKTEVKNTAFEELVITECASDEGLSFAIDLKLAQQGTPPNPLKSEAGVSQRDGLSLVDKNDVNNSHSKEREASPCSSDSSDESSSLSPWFDRPQTLNLAPNQHLLRRRFIRPKSARTVRYPQVSVSLEDEEVDGNDNRLPPLESQMLVNQTSGNLLSSSASAPQIRKLKQAIARTNSIPNSPASNQKLSPTLHDEKLVTKSAPGSPQNTRRLVFKPSVKSPQSPSGSGSPMSPNISSRMLDRRRGSEPVACFSRTNGVRSGRPRRDALIKADLPHGENWCMGSPIMHKRGKARYVLTV